MTLPPGPRLPSAAQTLAGAVRADLLLRSCADRYGGAFTLRFSRIGTLVVISDPDEVRRVFAADPQQLQAGRANFLIASLFGQSRVLMLLDGERHRARRRLLARPFGAPAMRGWRETMSEMATLEVERWPRDGVILTRPRMQHLTLEIILRVIFGLSSGSRLDDIRAAVLALISAAGHPALMFPWARRQLGPRSPWVSLQRSRRVLTELLVAEMVERRRASAHEPDVLSTLLAAAGGEDGSMDDEEIAEELITLLAAGHESTATALAWALHDLARRPDVMSVLAEEAEQEERPLTTAIVYETLRLHPPLPMALRRVVEPFDVAGHRIPPGVTICPCGWLTHRREDIYPDPTRFEPTRFLNRKPNGHEWLPFGGGNRRCIGMGFATMEMSVVLGAVARQLELRPAHVRPEPARRRAIVFAPAYGGQVRIARRG